MQNYFFVVLTLILLSCSTPPAIKDFDSGRWRADPRACAGQRLSMAEAMVKNKKLWLTMDDDVLIKLLGKPEKSFYYERNTKAYSYFIEPGSQCTGSQITMEGRKLTAEVNAIGFVSRIRIEN